MPWSGHAKLRFQTSLQVAETLVDRLADARRCTFTQDILKQPQVIEQLIDIRCLGFAVPLMLQVSLGTENQDHPKALFYVFRHIVMLRPCGATCAEAGSFTSTRHPMITPARFRYGRLLRIGGHCRQFNRMC